MVVQPYLAVFAGPLGNVATIVCIICMCYSVIAAHIPFLCVLTLDAMQALELLYSVLKQNKVVRGIAYGEVSQLQ